MYLEINNVPGCVYGILGGNKYLKVEKCGERIRPRFTPHPSLIHTPDMERLTGGRKECVLVQLYEERSGQ